MMEGDADDNAEEMPQLNDAGAAAGLVRRCNSYTVQARLRHALDCQIAIEHGRILNINEYARRYRLAPTTLRRWIQNIDEMTDEVERNAERRRVRTDHDGCWPEVENAVHQLFQDRRNRALPISRSDIVNDATSEFENFWRQLPHNEAEETIARRPERSQFAASVGWVTNFMKRKKIVFRRKSKDSTTVPADAPRRVRDFQIGVRQTVADNNVHTVLNFNETFAQLDFPPVYTIESRGTKDVDVRTSRGTPKLGCTIGLTIGSNGEKPPAHVVFRQPGFIRQIRGLNNVPENVHVTLSRTGWENTETLLHWSDNVLFPYLGDYDFNDILLLLDRFRAHLTEEFCLPLVEAGILLDNIPARCTSLAQPLDLTIMRGFKAIMRKYWKLWKTENTENDGSCRKISLEDVLGVISRAWNNVAPESAAKAFQVAGLTPEPGGHYRDAIVDDLLLGVNELSDDDDDDDLNFDNTGE